MVATPTHSKKQEIISSRKKPYKKLNHGWRAGRRTCAMQWRGWSPKNTPLPTCYRIEFGRSTSTGLGIGRWTPKNGIMGLPRRISVLFCWAILSMVKVVMWSRGGGWLTWRSQVGANPIPIPHPTNLALFGHKIALYRFNQGVILLQGLKSEQGLSPSPWSPSL